MNDNENNVLIVDDENQISEAQILSKEYAKPKLIPMYKLSYSEYYQRDEWANHTSRIAANLDPSAFGRLIVHKRKYSNLEKDTYFVIDGLQRTKALHKAGKGQEHEVPCDVITFDSAIVDNELKEVVAESIIFDKINIGRKNLIPLEKFFSRLIKANPVSTGVYNIVEETGFVIPRYANQDQGSYKNNHITCIATLESIYKKKANGQRLKEILQMINETWQSMAKNTLANTFYGLEKFISTYDETNFYTKERMINTMKNNTPVEIGTIAKKDYKHYTGATSFAKAFYDLYIKQLKPNERSLASQAWLDLSVQELRKIKKEG